MEMNIARTDRYDFVVCGGGPAGFACAVAAARKGVKTALVERQGCLGGTATSGGVSHLLAGRKLNPVTSEHVRVVGGLFDELTDALIAKGEAVEPNSIDLTFNPFGWYPRMASGIAVDETALKVGMDAFCADAGVRVYFFTSVIALRRDGGRVASVVAANKDGLVEIEAGYFADCTGDADLAAMAGFPFLKGRESDGLTAPCSLEMHLDHVDGDVFVRYQNEHRSPKLVEIIEELKQKGVWKFPYEIFVAVRLAEKDVFMVNTIRQIQVDGTDERSVSAALAAGRKENIELFHIIRQYFPGFAESRIRRIADYLGVRETRRIRGAESVTLQNALKGKKYRDCIAATTYNFDLPDPLSPSSDSMMGDAKNPNAARRHTIIQIPYGALIPKGSGNLIAAGRCISAERETLGPTRITGPCMMTGQAAGTAAAQVFASGSAFIEADTDVLRRTLWSDGVVDPDTLPFD